ncbi:MAG: hypothetical protein KGH63_03875, partial [Candidatus Micrarchaeota archaeon]|nr:hypothetical protein [Candidatus Micrarchaeota archaeon]
MVSSVTFVNAATSPGQAAPGLLYDPFAYTQNYIQTSFMDCEKTIYRTIYPINFYYKFVGKIFSETLGAEKLGGWYTSAYTGMMDYVVGNINNLLLLHYIQRRFLSVIKYVMPLLIEIGLVLRAFPLTRGTGGLLIAVGFGFFTVYPVSLALLTTLQAPPSSTFCTGISPPAMLNLNDVSCGTDPGAVMLAYYNIAGSQKETASLLTQIENFLPSFYLQAVFFPLVALTVTWSFTREFAELLSGDLNEIGRGLIKLI